LRETLQLYAVDAHSGQLNDWMTDNRRHLPDLPFPSLYDGNSEACRGAIPTQNLNLCGRRPFAVRKLDSLLQLPD